MWRTEAQTLFLGGVKFEDGGSLLSPPGSKIFPLVWREEDEEGKRGKQRVGRVRRGPGRVLGNVCLERRGEKNFKAPFFLGGIPAAYGNSQARDGIPAAAVIYTTAVAIPDP